MEPGRFSILGKRGNTTGSFGLAVPFADGETGPFLPDPDHFGIERFAGAGAMAQGREIEPFEIGKDQHPVNGRGAAERSDLVFFKEGEDLGCLEFPGEIVHKDAGPFDPLAEDLAPGTFCPAGIRDREVEVVVLYVLPEPGGDDVARAGTRGCGAPSWARPVVPEVK